MNDASPNPFKSPQAVDPPADGKKWRPRKREVLLGLAIVPLAFPSGIALVLRLINIFLTEFFPSVGWSAAFVTRAEFWRLATIAYLITFTLGLPICLLAAWRKRLSAKTVFVAGILLSTGFLVFAVLSESWDGSQFRLPPASFLMPAAPAIWIGVFSPFIAFALYLAYLRRRELRRTATPLQ